MNNEEQPQKKLKPVAIFSNGSPGRSARFEQGVSKQYMLLRALQVTSDPKKLKEMIGVRTVAEVYRTLDKMAIRKEFHKALDRAGVSFDFIVGGIREVAGNAKRDSDRLHALEILLKTLGLDKYEESSGAAKSWEEELLKAIEAKNPEKAGEAKELPVGTQQIVDYEVVPPNVPESVKKAQQKEGETMKRLYGI